MNQTPDLYCQTEKRRHVVREKEYNGLDYLQVSQDQRTLRVYFLHKAPEGLTAQHFRISGGQRIRDIQIVDYWECLQEDPELDDCVNLVVDRPGDFSTYTLCLVGSDDSGRISGAKFDPRYTCLEFSFKTACDSGLDCRAEPVCPPAPLGEPILHYLAKDYASFRQLILDQLALTLPDWQERHAPDLGVALVELLAYVGDRLSYYQDAVATEAYLHTARQRISLRRHARLVDYQMHEGCNARAWLHIFVSEELSLPLHEVAFATGRNQALPDGDWRISKEALANVPGDLYELFAPLPLAQPAAMDGDAQITLYPAHNEIEFYTWDNTECCLPRGATRATLRDEWLPQEQLIQDEPSAARRRKLRHLQPGDMLLFEEVRGPKTSCAADADPRHRHVVRLTEATPLVDPLHDQPTLEISWAAVDALPFALCISAVGGPPACALVEPVSVARGNILLVDHGGANVAEEEALGAVAALSRRQDCLREGRPSDIIPTPRPYRPTLPKTGLTFSQPVPLDAPASALLTQDARKALPQIRLTSFPDGKRWRPQRDLLDCAVEDRCFVVEVDNEGVAHLRFGDGELGHSPEVGQTFKAVYRTGNGPRGNVGAEAITHIVTDRLYSGVVIRPRNPLPAQGGTAAESLADVKLLAPFAFRHRLERAITAEDYAAIVMRDFKDKVQRATAVLRWTGSWTEVWVAIDPWGQPAPAPELLAEIEAHLAVYRRIGHEVRVKPACYAPLDVALSVSARPNYLPGRVKAALLAQFSNRLLPDGRLGFFHPDALTFGEGVYVSKLTAVAQAVPGVACVAVTKLERFGLGANNELAEGLLRLGPLEIARVDNDPSLPENGRFTLNMEG